jgi:ATP-dependent DNA helicase RecG
MRIETNNINDDQLNELMLLREGHFLDFKSKAIKPNKITRTISAFANASGGEVYVGMEEIYDASGMRRIWKGFNNDEEANGLIQAIEQLKPLGNHYLPTFLSHKNENGLILQLSIFKTPDIIYSSDGKAYVRRGAQNLPVVDNAGIERLRLDKGITSFENEKIDYDLSEISNSITIIDFLLNVIPSSEPVPWLKKQRLIIDNKPTVAGLLLFCDEPQAVLPKRSAIKIYRYQTKAEQGERDFLAFDPITIEGCLYNQIYNAINQCVEIIQGIEKLGPKGLEKVIYPTEAIHEILTNAVLHRDYSIASDIHIRIFDNRVEIENPGKLPGHVTIENILREQFARNPQLVRIINKFPNPPNKDVGEGLNTSFEAMEKLRLKPPIIEELDNSVKVTLKHESLGSPEQLVMEYLENHEEITNIVAREITGIKSENSMKDVFYRLRDAGQIEQVPGRSGRSSAWKKVESSKTGLTSGN